MQAKQNVMKNISHLIKKAGFEFSPEMVKIIPLVCGGSERKFYRIKCDDFSFVIMAGGSKAEVKSYIAIGRFLSQHALGPPDIIACDEETPAVLLEDLGNNSLYTLLSSAATAEQIRSSYKRVLLFLAEMQQKATEIIKNSHILKLKPFGYESLRWETDYFTECFLKQFCGIHIENESKLDEEYHLLADTLAHQTQYFMHRDFQSQNIYIKDGKVRIIDFQSARMGMLQYDAVSLLKDAYFVLKEKERNKLLYYYLEILSDTWGLQFSRSEFMRMFHLAGLQRNMQALGAFAFLSIHKGKRNFSQYIPNVLCYLSGALRKFDEFAVLCKLVREAETIVRQQGYSCSHLQHRCPR